MPTYKFSTFRLETEEKRLYKNGDIIPIPSKAFDVLAVLVAKAGHLFGKEELIQSGLGRQFCCRKQSGAVESTLGYGAFNGL